MNDGLTEKEKIDLVASADKDAELESYLIGVGINPELVEAYVWGNTVVFNETIYKSPLDAIESLFEALANLWWDGHYTVFRFTSGYKAAFGTPDLRTGQSADDLYNLFLAFPTMIEAMAWAIAGEQAFYPANKGGNK